MRRSTTVAHLDLSPFQWSQFHRARIPIAAASARRLSVEKAGQITDARKKAETGLTTGPPWCI
jgi:hypothetical protein